MLKKWDQSNRMEKRRITNGKHKTRHEPESKYAIATIEQLSSD